MAQETSLQHLRGETIQLRCSSRDAGSPLAADCCASWKSREAPVVENQGLKVQKSLWFLHWKTSVRIFSLSWQSPLLVYTPIYSKNLWWNSNFWHVEIPWITTNNGPHFQRIDHLIAMPKIPSIPPRDFRGFTRLGECAASHAVVGAASSGGSRLGLLGWAG